MPFNRQKALVLLPCIFYCASCAPRQKPCVRCALSCDGADVHELKKHQSVLVDVQHLSDTVHEEIYAVSSLFTADGCSVVLPDCWKWSDPVTLGIYAVDDKSSSEPLYVSWGLKPVSTDCDPEAVSDRDKTHPVGTALKSVEGIKGGNVTLRCEQDKDISDIRYVRRGKSTHFSDIPECLNDEYKHDSVQVCKTGACDIILKHLTFSDNGTYLLRFYHNNSPQELKFHLLVHDEISRGQRNSDESWEEVSKRGHRVSSDRRSERDKNLTINNFTVNDTESGQKLNRITEDTKARHHWVISGAVGTFVLAVVVLLLKPKRCNETFNTVPLR